MSDLVISTYLKNNEEYASTYDKGHLEIPPAKKLLIGESLRFSCHGTY
jgi:hypothetical protein